MSVSNNASLLTFLLLLTRCQQMANYYLMKLAVFFKKILFLIQNLTYLRQNIMKNRSLCTCIAKDNAANWYNILSAM